MKVLLTIVLFSRFISLNAQTGEYPAMTGIDTTGAQQMRNSWVQQMQDSSKSLAGGLIRHNQDGPDDRRSLPFVEITFYNAIDTFKTQTDYDGHFLIQTYPGDYLASFKFGDMITYQTSISLERGLFTRIVLGLDFLNMKNHSLSIQYAKLNEIDIEELRTIPY